MAVLTEHLVISRARAESLDAVRNLNLWGNELADVSILQRMTNVEVLSLSVNKIDSLREFRHCSRLTELYLRKNLIQDLTEVRYLHALQQLRVLWLCDNPCAEVANYRTIVIRALPLLTKLDNTDITDTERSEARELSLSRIPAILHPYIDGKRAPLDVDAVSYPPPRVPSASAMPIPSAPSAAPARSSIVTSAPVPAAPVQPMAIDEPRRWARPDKQIVESILAAEMPGTGSISVTSSMNSLPAADFSERPKGAAAAVVPRRSSEPRGERQSNVLVAVLALLKELDADDLDIVRKELRMR